MARLRGHNALDVSKPLYAQREGLCIDGATYAKGQEVRVDGLTQRLVFLLHDQRKIGHCRPEDRPQGAEPPPTNEAQRAAANEAANSGVIATEVHHRPKRGARGLAG